MAFIHIYVDGDFINAQDMEESGKTVTAPSQKSPTDSYGPWSSWDYNTYRYNHIVKKPTSVTGDTENLNYTSYIGHRTRTKTTTTYTNVWNYKFFEDRASSTEYTGTRTNSTSLTLYNIDGDYDVELYWTSNISGTSTGPDDDWGYWQGDTYTLPSVSFTGYTQKNYTGTGSVSGTPSQSKAPGSSYFAGDLTKWDGWFPFQNVTWTPQGYTLNTYKVRFNANGGSGTMDDQNFTYNESKGLSANAFTKSGSVFKGWATSSSSTTVAYTDEQIVSNLSVINNDIVNLYALWTDYYTVTWGCNIPNKFDVKATPYGNYPNSQNPECNKFRPNTNVRFDLSKQYSDIIKTTTFHGYPLYKYNNEFYIINNWGWENGPSYDVHYDYYDEDINRSGKFMANLYSGELTTYTLYTNYGKASINGVTATPYHPAQISLAKTQEYIYLAYESGDKNITFKHFEDSDGNIISDLSYIADDNTEIYAIFELNGQTCSILVPDTYEAVAEPVYIKDGLVTESNTRFISYKYPEYVDWAEVERITGKKPKIGDFYFMPVERQSKSQQGDI